MTSRADIDRLLRQLDADVPAISEDMNGFFRAFEDRAEMILGVVDSADSDYVLDCLMTMLRRHGINKKDGYVGPTLH